MKAKKRSTKKPAVKRKRNTKAPSAKQLAARRKFALAAKARAKAAKAKKASAKKRRNSTTIIRAKRIDHLDVSKVHNGKKKPAKAKKATPRKRRNSSTAIDNRKEFAGKYTGNLTLHFPQKSLSGLSTLGPLVSLEGEFGTIKPTRGGVYYCQDAKGRIHIGAKSADDLWARVKENLGTVRRVEYRAKKPHLGYPQETVWYHDFEAPYPVLKSDGQGGLMQVGGGYKIRREGIVG